MHREKGHALSPAAQVVRDHPAEVGDAGQNDDGKEDIAQRGHGAVHRHHEEVADGQDNKIAEDGVAQDQRIQNGL